MSWRYSFLFLLLFLFVFLLVLKNYELWTHPFSGSPEKGESKKVEIKLEGMPMVGSPKEAKPTESIESFIVIGEKNIFTSDRKEFSISSPDQSKPLGRPQIILYGVAIAEDYQSASIVNLGRPLRKGEREIITLKIGEQISGYKLAKILPDRITMEAPGDTFEVLLFDSSMAKRRIYTMTESKPTTITSTIPTSPASPPAVTPKPTLPQALPKAAEPIKPKVIEPPLPKPVTPTPIPDQGILRGRRPIRPYTPPESGGK
jgi:hypothetical protein